ncbi:hypothetical protein [Hafnia paralvei]|jgi:hypothetical protein|uniref:hypothetical protein n=1 Tax=Hafnia paralvei TaxID=546367 RepID=UPI000FA9D886|nr:hypothetical protein [Hafnia paralvei]MDX6842867.1 hypothetical protein [Hafnia paralvei]TBM05988.1 hypothetical protein EYY87_07805 [Hafnia paralvei]TBM29377.1 hypothetical protein EYY85_07000 [Hafnia paralvei]
MTRIISIMAILLAFLTLYFFLFFKQVKDINCISVIQYQYNYGVTTDIVSGSLLFILSEGDGIVTYSAKVTTDDKNYIINREANVEYSITNGFLHIKTVHLTNRDGDNLPENLAFKYLYSFLIKSNGWVSLKIDRDVKSGYIMSTSIVPQLYCNKL